MAGTATRIVFVAPYAPDALSDHAGGRFLFDYIAALEDRFHVTVVVPDRPDTAVPPDRLPEGVVLIRLAIRLANGSGIRMWRRARTTLLGFAPEAGFIGALRRSSDVATALASADIVEIQWTQMLPALRSIRRLGFAGPIGAFEHDVMFRSLQRRRLEGRPLSRIAHSVAYLVARVREPRLLRAFDEVMVFSDHDRELLQSLRIRNVHVVTPIVPEPEIPPSVVAAPRVLFVGAMWRMENDDAANWLLDDIWPRVVRKIADAELVIAGARPTSRLTARREPNVHVTGFVEDLSAVYRSARCFVAPLRIGAGVKFKVLEAMANALPVVATGVAAEGIVSVTGSDAFAAITDSAENFADAIVAMVRPGEEATAQGQRGRRAFEQHFSRRRVAEELTERYLPCN